MRIVPQAENHPSVCLVTRDFEGPFVDFETYTEEIDPHIYLSVALITQAAGLLDLIPRSQLEDLQHQLNVLKAETERLQKIVDATSILEEVGA